MSFHRQSRYAHGVRRRSSEGWLPAFVRRVRGAKLCFVLVWLPPLRLYASPPVDPPMLEFVWHDRGAPGCGDAEKLRTRVRQLRAASSKDHEPGQSQKPQIEVEYFGLEANRPRIRLAIKMGDMLDERVLEDENCETLLEAVALLVALRLDSGPGDGEPDAERSADPSAVGPIDSRYAGDRSASAWAARELALAQKAAESRRNARTRHRNAADEIVPRPLRGDDSAHEPNARWPVPNFARTLDVLVGAGLETGSLPRWGLDLRLAMGVSGAWWRLAFGGSWRPARETEVLDAGSARIRLMAVGGTLEAGLRLGGRRWEFQPGLGLEMLAWRADATGVETSRASSSLGMAATLGSAFIVWLQPRVGLRTHAMASVALTRPAFHIAGQTRARFVAAPVGFGATVAVIVQFGRPIARVGDTQ